MPHIPILSYKLLSKIEWLTGSNAAKPSRRLTNTELLLSKATRRSFNTYMIAVCIEWHLQYADRRGFKKLFAVM